MQAFCLISFSSTTSEIWSSRTVRDNKSAARIPGVLTATPARQQAPVALCNTLPPTTPRENNKRPYRPYEPRRRARSSSDSASDTWNPARVIRQLAYEGSWQKLVSRVDQISGDERTVSYAASLAYKAGKRGVADSLFRRMRARGVVPGPYSYSVMLKGLTRSRASSPSIVHSLVRDLESDRVSLDSVLLNSIADAFVRTGALRNACDFVRRDENSELRNSRTFNILMRGYVSARKIDTAFEIQQEMIDDGHAPTDVTINTLINGCARAGDYERAWALARELPKYLTDTNRSMEESTWRQKKNGITDSRNAIQVAMTAVMTSYVGDGRYEDARSLLTEIAAHIDPPSGITYASFVKACLRNGEIEYAKLVVDEMPANTESKIFAYNALVAGLCRMPAARTDIALQVVQQMLHEANTVRPVAETYNELLEGFRRRKDYDKVEYVMQLMEDNEIPPDVVSYTVLMRGFGARDDPVGARRVFGKMMKKNIRPDEVALNTLIAANCRGKTEEDLAFALRIVQEFENADASWRPTAATYSPVIAHYARQQEFDASWGIYERMKKYGIKPNAFVARMMYSSLNIFGPDIIEYGTPEQRIEFAKRCTAVFEDGCDGGVGLEEVRKWRRKLLGMFGKKKQLAQEMDNAQLRMNITSSSERIFKKHGWNDIDSSWKFM